MLTKEGAGVLLVYGDSDYCGRFGFRREIGHALVSLYPIGYPFVWMGVMMNETILPHSPAKFAYVAALSKSELWKETMQNEKFGNRLE